ncbi:MAG: ModE family transcriptional regulator [Chitinophagaceae bacterium]
MSKYLKNFVNGKYTVMGTLWIETGNARFFGPGPVELLQLIEQTGSINQAAKAMGMSYKKAWEMVNRINEQAIKPLVVTSAGGEKGGGSTISDEAKALMAYHKDLRDRFLRFLEKETEKINKS